MVFCAKFLVLFMYFLMNSEQKIRLLDTLLPALGKGVAIKTLKVKKFSLLCPTAQWTFFWRISSQFNFGAICSLHSFINWINYPWLKKIMSRKSSSCLIEIDLTGLWVKEMTHCGEWATYQSLEMRRKKWETDQDLRFLVIKRYHLTHFMKGEEALTFCLWNKK